MTHTVTITSAVPLNTPQLQALKQALKLTETDQITVQVNPEVIAGLHVSVDGQTVDLTVKRQLAIIENN